MLYMMIHSSFFSRPLVSSSAPMTGPLPLVWPSKLTMSTPELCSSNSATSPCLANYAISTLTFNGSGVIPSSLLHELLDGGFDFGDVVRRVQALAWRARSGVAGAALQAGTHRR